jgi:hydroxymethylpyrimidine/phosphomethylpyrimidine kinase
MPRLSTQSSRRIPVVLTVAGSDNSGGAGIQADLKTMSRMGVYGCSAVTCVVAEHPGAVRGIHPVPRGMVGEQIAMTAEAFPVAAVKTGMLYSEGLISEVGERLARHLPGVPLVVDPVMVASSGQLLFRPSAVRKLSCTLFPLAACVTPNLDETRTLLGHEVSGIRAMESAAWEAFDRWGVPFLIKGGHGKGREAVDILFDGSELTRFSSPRLKIRDTHGTGCTFSAAIASGLARGLGLIKAIRNGKEFVHRAMARHYRIGEFSALDHLQRSKKK